MLIQSNSKLVMIGDSVTDCERARPTGEGLFEALGKGYVSLVNAALRSGESQPSIRVVNVGTSGNTVRDLEARWQPDVFDLQPDWLSVMIGINDVWRQFDSPLQPEWGVPLEEYRQTLSRLIEMTQPRLKGLVLMTPYFIEPNRQDAMRVRMDQYGEVVRELARQSGAVLVDTQAAFDQVLRSLHPMSLAWDRVHPNSVGHMVLARAFLKAVGYRWE
jgi:lysophospholipase L1-like esterase